MGVFRKGIYVGAAVLVAAVAVSGIASADSWRGRGRGHWKHQRVSYRTEVQCAPAPQVVYQPQPVYVQPAPRVVYAPQPVEYQACAPRYVTYYPQRVMVVRPAPFVQVGAQFGAISIGAVFGGHRQYDYGCNFCDAHFSSFGAYENHVQHCAYRPANTRIECRRWDDQGYSQWNGRRPDSCRRENDDRYGYDNRQYDDRQYDDRQYDDRQYDNRDQGDDDYYDGR